MTDVNTDLVEKYQIMLQQDPRSQVFAPLAEAYRRMGLIDAALQICEKGIEYHPDFSGGRVALGRIYLQQGELEKAHHQLLKASDLTPENLLAQSLLGECLLKLRQPKEALKAYKMILFLNPNDQKIQGTVKKLESLTADDYDEDVFAMAKLGDTASKVNDLDMEGPEPLKPLTGTDQDLRRLRDLERFLSLSDAFLVRNDFDRALATLEEADKIHGTSPEIVRRFKLINQRFAEEDHEPVQAPVSRSSGVVEAKISLLKELQKRISGARRKA